MTPEEKRAEARRLKEEALKASLLAPRAGFRPQGSGSAAVPAAPSSFEGLELSEVYEKPPAWFIPDPENEEFQNLKDKRPAYWEDLRRDIQAAGILTPLLATKDGHLLQGHSRLKVAGELGLARIPVRLVLSPLSAEEIRKRRRLDNLLRFEIDEDTRLAMLAEIWPEFYLAQGKAGRPGKSGNGDTITGEKEEKTAHGDTITAPEIAEKTGKSVPQVKRDRALVRQAAALAQAEGKALPDPGHIKKVREKVNAERREAQPGKSGNGDTITPPEAQAGGPLALALVRFAQEYHAQLWKPSALVDFLAAHGLLTEAEAVQVGQGILDAFREALERGKPKAKSPQGFRLS